MHFLSRYYLFSFFQTLFIRLRSVLVSYHFLVHFPHSWTLIYHAQRVQDLYSSVVDEVLSFVSVSFSEVFYLRYGCV